MDFLTILIDILLVLVMITFFISGTRKGFWVTLGTLVGFLGGIVLSFLSIPLVSQWVASPLWRIAVVIVVAILLIFLGQAVGAAIGRLIRLRLTIPGLRRVDRFVGGLMNAVVAVTAYAVIAFSLSSLGVPWLTNAISQSKVVSAVTALAPKGSKEMLANLRTTVQGSVIPELVEPILPTAEPTKPATDVELEDNMAQARRSVVRVTGTAYECGQNQFGSGVAVSPNHILTNAHVVAGVNEPVIETNVGEVESTVVVHWDTSKDVALLYAEDANFVTMEMGTQLPEGFEAVVMGHPAGGPFKANAALVQGTALAEIPNIYGGGSSTLEIYQLAAEIRQGNSGGPLVDESGDMAGLIFAKAQGSDDTGYALTPSEYIDVVQNSAEYTVPVSSGQCVVG